MIVSKITQRVYTQARPAGIPFGQFFKAADVGFYCGEIDNWENTVYPLLRMGVGIKTRSEHVVVTEKAIRDIHYRTPGPLTDMENYMVGKTVTGTIWHSFHFCTPWAPPTFPGYMEQTHAPVYKLKTAQKG